MEERRRWGEQVEQLALAPLVHVGHHFPRREVDNEHVPVGLGHHVVHNEPLEADVLRVHLHELLSQRDWAAQSDKEVRMKVSARHRRMVEERTSLSEGESVADGRLTHHLVLIVHPTGERRSVEMLPVDVGS